MKVSRWLAVAGLLMAVGCSGSKDSTAPIVPPSAPPPPPPPPDPGPTVVLLASAVVFDQGSTDLVVVELTNSGGTGDFYLEFWGEFIRTEPSGCKVAPGQTSCPHPAQVIVALSQTVNVTAGYSQTLAYSISGNVSSVRVMSRAVNNATYTRSSCKPVRDYGACP